MLNINTIVEIAHRNKVSSIPVSQTLIWPALFFSIVVAQMPFLIAAFINLAVSEFWAPNGFATEEKHMLWNLELCTGHEN